MENYFDKSESYKGNRSEESAKRAPRNNRFNREDSTIHRKRSGQNNDGATPEDFTGRSFMKDRRQRNQESFTPREERSPRRNFNRDDRRAQFGRDEQNDRTRRFDRNEQEEKPRRFNREERGESRFNRNESSDRPARRSFNPNFDSENRPRFNNSERANRRFNRDEERSSREERFAKPRFNRNDERRSDFESRENRFRGERGERFERNDRGNRKTFNKRDNRRESAKAAYPSYDAAPSMPETMRLNRFISMSGICSRREADELISQGLVMVNGVVVTELGAKINNSDEVIYNGQRLKGEKKVYILMNKPKGYVTTIEDPNTDKTVISLISNACQVRVYPVGRLDKNSLGVLLITNDGDLTKKLTHPSYNKKKIYQVDLNKNVSVEDLQKIYNGVELEDGVVEVDDIQFTSESKRQIGIEIHSGRNRVVRRLFESLGYSVVKLDRVYFAGLTKKNLPRGRWRFLTDAEVSMLKSGSYE
jgi:23S rRNA pseudouridine2605 synthase